MRSSAESIAAKARLALSIVALGGVSEHLASASHRSRRAAEN